MIPGGEGDIMQVESCRMGRYLWTEDNLWAEPLRPEYMLVSDQCARLGQRCKGPEQRG